MRIGVIGTGSMGRNHLRVVSDIPQFQLTCGVDVRREALLDACAPFQIKTFQDYREIVDLIDGVMISTPTDSHFTIAKFFLEQGKHVLIEKPIVNEISQADQLIQLAGEKKLIVAVGHLERFNPAVEYVNSVVNNPRFVEVQRLGPFSHRSIDIDVIMDLMIHDLDIILNWDKSGIREIRASGIPIITEKCDICNARIEFNSGMIANITASRVSQKKTRKLRIFQKNIYMSIDYKKQRVKRFDLRDGQIVELIPELDRVEPLFNLWYNFYRTIREGGNFSVTGEDGRDALAVAKEILERIKI